MLSEATLKSETNGGDQVLSMAMELSEAPR